VSEATEVLVSNFVQDALLESHHYGFVDLNFTHCNRTLGDIFKCNSLFSSSKDMLMRNTLGKLEESIVVHR